MIDTKVVVKRVPLLLSKQIDLEIRHHGAEDYPNETCGAMLGIDGKSGREVKALSPLKNRRDDSPQNRFSITPEDFREAEEAAMQQRLELVGWYHSHPDHPARPSEFDRQHAWPWYSYVIVNVTADKSEKVTAWLLAEDRSHFDRQEIRTG